MDTPESPTQSPQSPEDEEKGFSNRGGLDSPDEEADGVISDSELLQDDEDGGIVEEDREMMGESQGQISDLEDEVVPDFVSDPEDDKPVGETGEMSHEDETILLMDGDEDGPQEEEERVIDTPRSPDSEPEQALYPEEDGDDADEGYGYYKRISAEQGAQEADDDEEDEENKDKPEEDEESERRRRAAAAREMKDDSASVSRELDEHELDYDEEVPEEPSIPAHDEEDDEDETKAKGEEEEQAQSDEKNIKKKEKKRILPPSPNDPRREEDSKGLERTRRDSFIDRKKEDDDGEIDEGEIDVSYSFHVFDLKVVKKSFSIMI